MSSFTLFRMIFYHSSLIPTLDCLIAHALSPKHSGTSDLVLGSLKIGIAFLAAFHAISMAYFSTTGVATLQGMFILDKPYSIYA